MLPTIYLKKMPNGDVNAYTDELCTGLVCTFPVEYKSTPTRRNKYVTINTYRYAVCWK